MEEKNKALEFVEIANKALETLDGKWLVQYWYEGIVVEHVNGNAWRLYSRGKQVWTTLTQREYYKIKYDYSYIEKRKQMGVYGY
jgi:hypothetical protein